MNVRNTRARLCAVLFTSLFTSISFAQVSAVPDRASLAGDDFIDWQSQSGGLDPNTIPPVANVSTDGGMAVTVEQISPFKDAEPSSYVGTAVFASNLPAGDFNYYLYPYYVSPDYFNYANPLIFTDFDGEGICGFGTQIAPYELGGYVAWLEAFDADGASVGLFETAANTGDAEAAFIGFESTDPVHRVEVSMQSSADGGGYYVSFYAINQVDLKVCEVEPPEPEVPVMYCEGFGAPMDRFPVTVKGKGKRVFPLKMELFDEDGFALTDLDVAAAPLVDVMFTSSSGGDPVDVTGDLLSVGKASEGNQFLFKDGIWQFKLSSKNYSAKGTYLVTVLSGDETEYTIDPSCVTSFIKK